MNVPGVLGWPGGWGGSGTENDRTATAHPQRKLRKQDTKQNWSCPRQAQALNSLQSSDHLTESWLSLFTKILLCDSPRRKWGGGGGTEQGLGESLPCVLKQKEPAILCPGTPGRGPTGAIEPRAAPFGHPLPLSLLPSLPTPWHPLCKEGKS